MILISASSILAKHNLELASEDSESTSSEGEEEESSESGSESSDSDSSSSSSSSSSSESLPSREPIEVEGEGSDEESKITKKHKKNKAKLSRLIAEDNDSDDEFDEPKGALPVTAHEIIVPTVALPSITEIGPEEPMELIGDVLNVVDSVVVVKSFQNGMQRVLDTESLLVLEDRKVLGLVSMFISHERLVMIN